MEVEMVGCGRAWSGMVGGDDGGSRDAIKTILLAESFHPIFEDVNSHALIPPIPFKTQQ
jgi:hypothetical protein